MTPRRAGPKQAATLFLALVSAGPVPAQVAADTTLSWYTYAERSVTRVRLMPTPEDERRPLTVLVDELTGNRGPTVAEDLPFLADRVARGLGFQPEKAEWYLRFSLETTGARRRTLLFRVLLPRTPSGRIGAPSWRPVPPRVLRDRVGRVPDAPS